jgi:hypothetical protein
MTEKFTASPGCREEAGTDGAWFAVGLHGSLLGAVPVVVEGGLPAGPGDGPGDGGGDGAGDGAGDGEGGDSESLGGGSVGPGGEGGLGFPCP